MKGILPESIRLRNWKGDFTALNNDAVAASYVWFKEYLGTESCGVRRGYMDLAAVESLLPSQRGDRNNALPARQVIAAVALELWLRVFWRSKEFSSQTA